MNKNRTRTLYAEALLELSKKKKLNKITVQDLLDHTQTARQTFYNHFRDKNDLIQWVYAYFADKLLKEFFDGTDLYSCYYNICRYLFTNKEFFRQAVQLNVQNNLLQEVFNHSSHFFQEYITDKYGDKALTQSVIFAISFNNYGANSMIHDWLLDKLQYSPAEIAQLILESMPLKLKELIQ